MRWPFALALVAACKDTPAPPPPPPPPPAPIIKAPVALPSVKQYTPEIVSLPEPVLELPKQESFEVLEPGAGDRSPLRYALAPGTVTARAETKLVSRHLQSGAFSAPLALPAIRDGFAVTVEGAGVLALRPLVAEPAGEPYLATWRAQLEGRRVKVAFDARGQLGAVTFGDDPANARSAAAKDELLQRLLATTVPLPEAPVGIGARWVVVTVLRQGSAYVKQTATYTLLARAPTAWKLHVKLLRVGEEQRVADPALPPGVIADLIALFRLLEGDVTLDPAHPFLASGSLTIESRLHAKLRAPNTPPLEQLLEDTGTVSFALSP